MPGSNNEHAHHSLARHRAGDIAAQFPESLNQSEVEQMTLRVDRLVRSIDELRRYPLTNADEPAVVFRATGKEKP